MMYCPDPPYKRHGDDRREEEVYCPMCGEQCDFIYINEDKEAIGCDVCVTRVPSWRYTEIP